MCWIPDLISRYFGLFPYGLSGIQEFAYSEESDTILTPLLPSYPLHEMCTL